MDRLKMDDLIMGAYLDILKSQGYEERAKKIKKIYEVQRAEIIANEGDKKE